MSEIGRRDRREVACRPKRAGAAIALSANYWRVQKLSDECIKHNAAEGALKVHHTTHRWRVCTSDSANNFLELRGSQ